MRNKSKKILLINLIFLVILSKLAFANLIIPQKKPIISAEAIEKSKINNFIIPKKKPDPITDDQIKITDNQESSNDVIDGIILPKSKPLVVKKDSSIIKKKSKYN